VCQWSPVVIVALDRAGVVTLAVGQGLHTLGMTSAGIVGHNAFDLYGDHPAVLDTMRRALAGEATSTLMESAGRVIEVSYAPLTDAQGQRTGALGVETDVTARVQAAEVARANEARFRALCAHAADLVALIAVDGTIRYASPSHQRVLGYPPETLQGANVVAVVHPADRARVRAMLGARGGRHDAVSTVTARLRHADGSWRLVELTATRRLDDPAIGGLILNGRDVTTRVAMEAALRQQALHDALTGLPNRTLLQDRLRQALRGAARARTPLALGLLDLDHFKEVNDTLGHDAGDALLREVSRRIQGTLRASDTVARLGGDEFAVVLPGDDATSAVSAARKILAVLTEPIMLPGQRVVVGGSLGIALYPAHGADAATLLRHADVAMYAAKRTGGGCALYTAEQDPHTPQRLTLLSALHHAITHDELRLHYQPTVDVTTGQVRMVEALVRWPHPEQGVLPPDAFLPLAEQTGLIVPLTRWVLDTALRQIRAWRADGLDLGVAVNLSARALRDPDLPATIAGLLQAHGVPAARLCLELPERLVMADPTTAVEILTRLSQVGVRLAIDAGTGSSALTALTRLPVDAIKIDRPLITPLGTDADAARVVAATIARGHARGLHVVATGVEDEQTWQVLAALSCDGAQGYYVSQPLPADDLARWLRATSGASGSGSADA